VNGKDEEPRVAAFEEIILWGIRQGEFSMDVDGWLDSLMGPKLDDTRLVGFAIFRYEGQLFAIATGYNKDGVGRSGAIDLVKDEVIFPNRPEFKKAGAYFRKRVEQLMPGVTPVRPR
jgi:hypothetical protein